MAKDQLKIFVTATKAELVEVIPITSFLSGLPGGFLFWFESPDFRESAMAAVSAAFPGATFDVIEHDDQETVESEKAVIDTPPPEEPEDADPVEPEPEVPDLS